MLKWFILHGMEGVMLQWGYTRQRMQIQNKVKQETREEKKNINVYKKMRRPYKKGYKNLHWPSGIGIQQKAPQYYSIFYVVKKLAHLFYAVNQNVHINRVFPIKKVFAVN